MSTTEIIVSAEASDLKQKKLFIICMLLCYSVMSSENSEEFVSLHFFYLFIWFFCCCFFCKHCPKKQLKQAPYQNFHFLSNCFSSGVKSKKLKGV